MPAPTVAVASSIDDADPAAWNALAAGEPCLRHEFIHALEASGCASKASGWTPRHLLLRESERLAGAMPLYLKSHSYGEYVFDWSWAQAWERLGKPYYPKLVAAVPFTPVPGPRAMARLPVRRAALLEAALDLARESGASTFHCLLPPEAEARELAGSDLLLRTTVQFGWENRGYKDFEEFLDALRRDKRKKIRQERRRLAEAGIACEWIEGRDMGEAGREFFARCYDSTYRRHGSHPYLNREFFRQIGEAMPEHLLLVRAAQNGRPVGAALFLKGPGALYGRWWGAVEFHPGLHFEVCYYQGVEYAIAKGLARFEGGVQGEHKIARGLLPARAWSVHWVADPRLRSAVADFLRRESAAIDEYLAAADAGSPFRTPEFSDAI